MTVDARTAHATTIAAKAYAERHYGLPYARLDAAARAACLAHAHLAALNEAVS